VLGAIILICKFSGGNNILGERIKKEVVRRRGKRTSRAEGRGRTERGGGANAHFCQRRTNAQSAACLRWGREARQRKRGRRTGVGRELKGVCVPPCFSPSNTRAYLSAPDKRGGRKFLESHKGERGTGRRRRSAPSPPTGSPHDNALCRDGG